MHQMDPNQRGICGDLRSKDRFDLRDRALTRQEIGGAEKHERSPRDRRRTGILPLRFLALLTAWRTGSHRRVIPPS